MGSAHVTAVVERTWCGGDTNLTEDALVQAYLRNLPQVTARRSVVLAALVSLPGVPYALSFLEMPFWLAMLTGTVSVSVSALALLLFTGPSEREIATVSLTDSRDEGLFSAELRSQWVTARWKDLPARLLTTQQFQELALSAGHLPAVVDTALVLMDDGWPGSSQSLLETASALEGAHAA